MVTSAIVETRSVRGGVPRTSCRDKPHFTRSSRTLADEDAVPLSRPRVPHEYRAGRSLYRSYSPGLIISGELKRGPRILTDNGFEWLARLLIEPGRLWRRYVIGNPLFLLRVLMQRLTGKGVRSRRRL